MISELGVRVYYADDEIIYHVEEMKQASWVLDLILDTVETQKDILVEIKNENTKNGEIFFCR